MNRLNYVNKKTVSVFAVLFLTGIVFTMIPVHGLRPHHIATFSYMVMIMMWSVTIQTRVTDRQIRRRILIACFFMVLLFVLRMCKYSYFPDMIMARLYIWYAYSVPLTFIPLFFFLAALYVEPIGNRKTLQKIENALILINAVFAVVTMTNELHSFVYKITVYPDKEYSHEWFYYLLLLWRIALAMATIYILFKKCSITAARRKWYIPAVFIALSSALLIWYLINGGAPKIGTHKLFQFHEALCIPYMMAFESMILIGMIPANSGYRILFDHLSMGAAVYDSEDRQIMASRNWKEDEEDEDHRVCREQIQGGCVRWLQDLSTVNEINRSIETVKENLEDENELIRQENEIRSERIRVETRNRLYNRIAEAVRTRAVRVDELLSEIRKKEASPAGEEEEERDRIIYAMIMSAYIKRMGNLILLTDTGAPVSTEELALAVSESLEYLKLKGSMIQIYREASMDLPPGFVLLAYELFEETIEDIWLRINTVTVSLAHSDGFEFLITLDEPAEAISSTWKDKELRAAGAKLTVRYEDETYYISLKLPESELPESKKEAVR